MSQTRGQQDLPLRVHLSFPNTRTRTFHIAQVQQITKYLASKTFVLPGPCVKASGVRLSCLVSPGVGIGFFETEVSPGVETIGISQTHDFASNTITSESTLRLPLLVITEPPYITICSSSAEKKGSEPEY
ncbi:24999_t:CDS:2 [Gigaspora margarita]|uniref:24999_t:CDS:1 n=1 Tax=Gigaspora margarita TaxID=4874 RepID=A0ABM8W2X1_GIGMA|nr:24999_t:CDS:2 [Gigaspora margarita]